MDPVCLWLGHTQICEALSTENLCASTTPTQLFQARPRADMVSQSYITLAATRSGAASTSSPRSLTLQSSKAITPAPASRLHIHSLRPATTTTITATMSANTSFNNAAFEAEKAAITSYEENWDSWDGPVWDWRSTNVPAVAPAANKALDAVKQQQRPGLSRNPSSCSSIASVKSDDSDWYANATPACSRCGHGSATMHV